MDPVVLSTTCVWFNTLDEVYKVGCGIVPFMNLGKVSNSFRYCPYCGRKLVLMTKGNMEEEDE